MSDLNASASPANGTAASPVTGTAAASNGTTQPSGEAGQGATGSENFLPQGMDLNTLPPAVRAELERINKDMVRGFTAKTQELAEKSKKYADYDTLKQDAELYRQVSKEEQFVKMWNDYVQKASGSQTAEGKDPALTEMQKKLQEMELKNNEREAKEVIAAFVDAVDDKGEKLHPHFDKYNQIVVGTHPEIGEFSLLRAAIELAPGSNHQEKLDNGYKAVEAVYNSIFEEGSKSGMGKMLSKIKNSTDAPTLSTDKGVFTGDPKSLSAREARELAEKRVAVR